MRDGSDRSGEQDAAIDRAYRAATAASEDEAARRRRRAAVLGRVVAIDDTRPSNPARADEQPAANEEHAWGRRRVGGRWSGAVAACLMLVASGLVVLHLRDTGPDDGTQPPRRAQAPAAGSDEAARPAATAGAAKPAPTDDASASARQRNLSDASPPAVAPPSARPMPAAPPTATVARSADAEPRQEETAATTPRAHQRMSKPAVSRREAPVIAATPASPPSSSSSSSSPPPLLAAVAARDVDAARRLLQTMARPDQATDGDGRTALALAVIGSDPRLVKLLVDHGADRLARDRFGRTPLDYARSRGDAAVLRALGETR